jgi:hypothetical protein
MKKENLIYLVILISALLLFISACTPSRISVNEYEQSQGGATVEVQETTALAVETEPSEGEQPPAKTEVIGGVPADIPVSEEAYQVQAGRSGNNVIFQIDGTVEEVVTYYQETLPDYGWEMAGPPDNVVASIATMLRENANGDTLAINMQANDLGGFVRVTITISRSD